MRGRDDRHFIKFCGPLLNALRSLGGSGAPEEVAQRIAQDLNISDDTQNELLPWGEPRFQHQIHWAQVFLGREGLLDSSKRGVWSLSERGRTATLSAEQSTEILLKWRRINQERCNAKAEGPETVEEQNKEPQDTDIGDYRTQLRETLLKLPPDGFERLSQRLLREAGFIQVDVTGRSGDGGIDGHGTLEINPFVFFKVYFQCKRYTNAVSSSEVVNFRGAMSGRTDKGIFITTGTFTANAKREASRDGVCPIELIDGESLMRLMEKYELGLKPVPTFQLDEAFFNQFRSQKTNESKQARDLFS